MGRNAGRLKTVMRHLVSFEPMQVEPSVPATIGKGKFEAAVVAARIITLADIANIPGFADLTMQQQQRIAFTPANLQWVSRPVYWLRRGRSAGFLRGSFPIIRPIRCSWRTGCAPSFTTSSPRPPPATAACLTNWSSPDGIRTGAGKTSW
jgi:hypothetical protein